MTRMIEDTKTAPHWDVPPFWRSKPVPVASVPDQPRSALLLLGQFLAAVLAAEARSRDAQRMERMCDRMRADIGLPMKGEAARQLERRTEELQRWS